MKILSQIGSIFVMILSGLLLGFAFQTFLIPEKLLSSGLSGVAMVIGYLSPINISWLYLAFNVPIFIWGLVKLGRRFVILSFTNVVSTVVAMQLLPLTALTHDRLLAAVFGGALSGIGITLALRFGGSTGGFDIIASIISRSRDISIGLIMLTLNAIVILALGGTGEDWNAALYSMLSIYVTSKIVDTIYTPHYKVTAFIVTNQTEKLKSRLLQRPRGVTIIRTKGAFSSEEKDMLMTVTSRYELEELRKIIKEVDNHAFVNVVQTLDVIGQFGRS